MQTHRALPRRLAGALAIAVLLLTFSAGGATGATASVVLTPVVSGLDSPVQVVSAGDGSGRLFVVEQGGTVRIVKNGVLLPKPFIDIADLLSTGGERGLLGIAFHPNYKTNGRFFLYFTRRNDGHIAITEYHRSRSNPDLATRVGAKRIITISHPYANHNGGRMAFSRGGYLYIGTGDGGSAGDPGNRAQNLDSLLGKMLRIDVNRSVGSRNYGIPPGNPYLGRPGLNEIWARGLRNPWGWSFDKVTGDLWIGDVGQDKYEEIDRSIISSRSTSGGKGVDYGWRVMEGRHCYKPASGCHTAGLKFPVVEYSHSEGCAVTGGYAYRGSAVLALYGKYVFGDFCSGKIWTISRSAVAPATKSLLLSTGFHISSFGQDEKGELYVLDIGGTLYKMEAP